MTSTSADRLLGILHPVSVGKVSQLPVSAQIPTTTVVVSDSMWLRKCIALQQCEAAEIFQPAPEPPSDVITRQPTCMVPARHISLHPLH